MVALLKNAPAQPALLNAFGQLAYQMKTRGHTPDPRAVTPLLALLMDPATRNNAEFALKHFNDPRISAALNMPTGVEPIEALIAATNASDTQQRLDATSRLAELGPHVQDPSLRARVTDAFLVLVELPPSGEYGPIRYQAVMALGEMDDRRVVDALIAVLTDPGWMIRSEAAVALGKLKDPRAIPALQSLLNHPDDATRDSARKALQTLL
jgi:HEAT repeat protein